MDLVRDICSTALSIRDQKNLRVRLPLKKLTIIGKNSQDVLAFKDIIADEVNVKNIEISNDLSQIAEFKLQINFKKIGAKYSSKMKEILQATKENNWQKTTDNKIKIADIILEQDEFELKILPKNNDDSKNAIAPLSNNEYLISLDIEITDDLEYEGLARDIIRVVQQNRKEADLDISDRIVLSIQTTDNKICEVIKEFGDYISKQVLAEKIETTSQDLNNEFVFENEIDDKNISIGIKIFE